MCGHFLYMFVANKRNVNKAHSNSSSFYTYRIQVLNFSKYQIHLYPGPWIRYGPDRIWSDPTLRISSDSTTQIPIKSYKILSDFVGFRWIPYWIRSDPLSDPWTWIMETLISSALLRKLLILSSIVITSSARGCCSPLRFSFILNCRFKYSINIFRFCSNWIKSFSAVVTHCFI